jgi:hypothetical protein
MNKSQLVRLLDVYAVGPYFIQAARFVSNRKVRVGLVVLGVATMLYNGRNYNLTEAVKNDGDNR